MSQNWAGSIVQTPSDTNLSSVTGTFIVPDPKLPAGATSAREWRGAAWVGIDGFTPDEGGLLQAGVVWEVVNTVKNGTSTVETSFEAVYEWLPATSAKLGNVKITAGDVITVSCQAADSFHGSCSIENHSTGVSAKEEMVAPTTGAGLNGHHAEWIVEDFYTGHGNVPLANFGTVEWYGCAAAARPVAPSTSPQIICAGEGMNMIMADQKQNPLTTVSISGENMAVTYIQ